MWPMLPAGDDNPFLRATVGDMLAIQARRAGDREAIVATDRRITYARLHEDACRLARGLLALGVRKGDKVALWMPNRPEWFATQYGCGLIGAVVVALNTRYKAHELRYILRQSDASTLVCADHAGPVDYLETLAEVLADLRPFRTRWLFRRGSAYALAEVPTTCELFVGLPRPSCSCFWPRARASRLLFRMATRHSTSGRNWSPGMRLFRPARSRSPV
mgnify:CR=1 FL=1